MNRFGRSVVAAFLMLAGAACGPRAPEAASPAATQGKATALDLMAVDFGFEGVPRSVPAGPVTVTLTNEGAEEHQAVLVRLNDGVSAEQYLVAAAEDAQAAYQLIESYGGPSPLAPGGVGRSTSALTPGAYLAICFIPSPSDGTPHADKGMVAAFEVTGPAAAAAAPEPDGTISANEFSFGVAPDFTGRGTFALDNVGEQVHELAIYRMEDGETLAGVEAFLAAPPAAEPGGPPPIVAVGGIGHLAPGRRATVDLDLPSGDYAFACFLPDVAADGVPHFVQGMLQQVSVP